MIPSVERLSQSKATKILYARILILEDALIKAGEPKKLQRIENLLILNKKMLAALLPQYEYEH